MNEYDDIINLKRPKSKRLKMDISQRANIFNPFAALTGYAESINEAGRIVSQKIELDPDKKADLDNKINELINTLPRHISLIYFVPDKYKQGGKYNSVIGVVKKININDRIIVIDNLKISFDDLYIISFVEEE